MVTAVLLLASLLSPNSSTSQGVEGLTISISADAAAGVGSSGYASIVEIRREGRMIATLRTRSLIEKWLKDDVVWGGHKKANEARFSDHPTSDANARLQGKILEAVPAPGGYLLRMGLIDTSPSRVMIGEDFLLRWKESSPKNWTVLRKLQDYNGVERPNIRLPQDLGVQFLIANDGIYKLVGDELKATLAAPLPDGIGWTGIGHLGHRILITLPIVDPGKEQYLVFDFGTGKLSDVSQADRKAFGIYVPAPDPDQELPPAMGTNQQEGGMPPPLFRRHDPAVWSQWVRIASDARRTPQSRNHAFTELIDLVAPWGHGPWTLPAIQAAHSAIRSGPQILAIGAIRAVRAWIWNYPQILGDWSPQEMKSLHGILADPAFQSEVLAGAIRQPFQDPSQGVGPMFMKPGSDDVRQAVHVWICSYGRALAISQSPKAFEYLKSKVSATASMEESEIDDLGYLRDPRVKPYLYSLVLPFSHHKLQPNVINGDGAQPRFGATNGDGAQSRFGAIVVSLARQGETRFDPLIPILTNRKLDRRQRAALMQALANFADDRILGIITKIALDSTENKEYRASAISSVSQSRPELAKPALALLAKSLSEADLRQSAEFELTRWDELHQTSYLQWHGFGPPGNER